MAHAPIAAQMDSYRPELLLLFRGQQLADVLYQRDTGHLQVRPFGSDTLYQLLHFGEIHRIRFQQGWDIERHGVDLGPETNHISGMRVQEGLHLGALHVTQVELLRQPGEEKLESHPHIAPHARPLRPPPLLFLPAPHARPTRSPRLFFLPWSASRGMWILVRRCITGLWWLLRLHAWDACQRQHTGQDDNFPRGAVHVYLLLECAL